jgi:hypothetical protein
MIAILLLAACAAADQVNVRIAPDHPLRVVYTDEPLTLQIKSPDAVRVRGLIEVRGKRSEPHVEALRSFELKPGQPFLQTIEAFSETVGYYDVNIVLHAGGDTVESDQSYCRLARPNPDANPRLAVAVTSLDDRTLLALNAIPIKEIWIDATTPKLGEIIARAKEAELRVVVRVRSTGSNRDIQRAQALGDKFGKDVSTWVIGTRGNPKTHNRIAAALTQTARRRVIATASNVRELGSLLNGGVTLNAQEFAVRPDRASTKSLRQVRNVAERAGLEQPTFVVEYAQPKRLQQSGHELVQALIADAAGGARLTIVPLETLVQKGGLTQGAVYLHAFAAQMGRSSYVGQLPLGEGNFGAMFREDASWRVAYWTNHNRKVMQVRPGSAEDVALTDSWNNPIQIQTANEGLLRLEFDAEPRYLSGQGGSVLAQAATTALSREMDALIAAGKNEEELPADLMGLLKQEKESEKSTLSRIAFITLLQSFPYLEKQARDDAIDQSVAIPAMAALTRLLESAYILEQERGKPFLETPRAALERCNQFRTEYVTNLADDSANGARSQWLLAEIGRLESKARSLVESGRKTEATGIATLAEWRARSLQFTTRTPVQRP